MEPLYLHPTTRQNIIKDLEDKPHLRELLKIHAEHGGSLSDAYSWLKNKLLNRPTEHFEDFLEEHGDEQIHKLMVSRIPLNKAVELGINLITKNKFKENKKKYNYEDVYHLRYIITMDSGVYILGKKIM